MTFVSSRRKPHDTRFSPLGLWQLDVDGSDSSGNGRDLTPIGSPVTASGIFLGDRALHNNTNQAYTRTDSTFQITGAITLMGFFRARSLTNFGTLIEFGAVGETEDTNILYQVKLRTDYEFAWFHEYGAGNNILEPTAGPALIEGEWQHFAATRDSAGTAIKLFLNGVKVHDVTVSNAATGGGSSTLKLAADHQASPDTLAGALRSVQIIGSELTESQVTNEAIRVLGV